MPMYDITCSHCEGIFEKLMSVSALHHATTCPYCHAETMAAPAVSGARVSLRMVNTWKPRSKAEQLAGAGADGPGAHAGASRSSVLHNCKGFNCSMCGTA
jgi:putative FmdB family regulatory protein